MGCFNTSCGISRLNIHADEEVYVVLIANTNEYDFSTPCYANEAFTPIAPPILCTYDEYGRYFPVESHIGLAASIIKNIRKYLIEDNKGDGHNRDHKVLKDTLNWEILMDCMHDERIRVQAQGAFSGCDDCRGANTSVVSSFAIKKDVYEGIMGMTIPHWRGDITWETCGEDIDKETSVILNDPYDYSEDDQKAYDRKFKKLTVPYTEEQIAKQIKFDGKEREQKLYPEDEAKQLAHEEVLFSRRWTMTEDRLFQHIGVDGYGSSLKVETHFRRMKKDVREQGKFTEDDLLLIKRCKDIRILGQFMDGARIQWFPPNMGSQDENHEYHTALMGFMAANIEKDKKRWCYCDDIEEDAEHQVCEYCDRG